MAKEVTQTYDEKELKNIVNLRFGDVVTNVENNTQQFLILGTVSSDNIHGSLIHFTENDEPYIIAGGGGTMSDFEFGKLIKHLEPDEAIEIAKRGWKIQFGEELPSDLVSHLQSEAKLEPVIFRRGRL